MMTSDYKVLTDEGEFKVEFGVFKAPLKRFKCLPYHKTILKWCLTVFLLIFITSLIYILFSICWLLLSKKAHTCLTPLNSFRQALSFSIYMHTQMTFTQNTINLDCYLVVLMFLLQTITFIIWKTILLVVVLKIVLHVLNKRVKFNKITLSKNIMFYEMTQDQESEKIISNSCVRKESTTIERRGSVVAYRKTSIFGRRESKAECHRFSRQKTVKSARYQKLKTKKSAKETVNRSLEVFKMVVEVDGDNVVFLEFHAFLLVKKKVKTALNEFLEVLATREIKFEKEENIGIKDEEMKDVTKKLIHKVDDKSVMKEFMKFIVKKKKWKKEEKMDVGSENEVIKLWSDECISVSKMQLEVLIVLQYQHIHSTLLSEIRRSFSLADFQLHNLQNMY